MKIINISFLLSLLLFSSFVFSQDEAKDKGIVSFVDGKVKKKMLDDSEWVTEVVEKGKVGSRESYRTMIKSRAELELSEMDILRLAPKTTIDIVALYEESYSGKQKTEINLEDGDLWAQVNSADDENEFEMGTDISAAAITGTNFRIKKDNEQTQMKVYHGEVKIANSKNSLAYGKPVSVDSYQDSGQESTGPTYVPGPKEVQGPEEVSGPKEITLEEWIYVVKNMQQITFDKNGKVISAGEFSRDDTDEQSSWIEWNKKRDRERGMR